MWNVPPVSANEPVWAIALHGGASAIPKDIPDERKEEYRQALSRALQGGTTILQAGGTALDAVEAVVVLLEDSPVFNAGKGAVFTAAGTHELDASIMDGATSKCGGVAIVEHLKNPVRAARAVMEKSPHVLLAGPEAEAFAIAQGCEKVPNSYFFTERRWAGLQETLKGKGLQTLSAPRYGLPSKTSNIEPGGQQEVGNTVGCVALDRHGNLAAATSTGGRSGKMPGRVGDSPIPGAGNYADKLCAVSGTGIGEEFLRYSIAAQVGWQRMHQKKSIEEACRYCLTEVLKPGDGGLIAVDKDGKITAQFTTGSLSRGIADSDGRFEVSLWEEPLK